MTEAVAPSAVRDCSNSICGVTEASSATGPISASHETPDTTTTVNLLTNAGAVLLTWTETGLDTAIVGWLGVGLEKDSSVDPSA